MINILITFFTILLILISIFLILTILIQQTGSDSGFNISARSNSNESLLSMGIDNTLKNITVYASILFFIINFGLYLGHIYIEKQPKEILELPKFEIEELNTDIHSSLLNSYEVTENNFKKNKNKLQ